MGPVTVHTEKRQHRRKINMVGFCMKVVGDIPSEAVPQQDTCLKTISSTRDNLATVKSRIDGSDLSATDLMPAGLTAPMHINAVPARRL